MTKAVVFDLDGTLIDSLGDIAAALNRLLAAYDRPTLLDRDVELLVGEGVNVLVQGAWAQTGSPMADDDVDEMVVRYLDLYLDQAAQRTIVFKGVPEMLKALRAKGWRLGICTNKPDKITDRVLADLGLAPLVDAVVGGDYPRRKPDGDHILETLRRLDVPAAACLYVGDSKTDVAAARMAGVPIVCVGFGYSHGPAGDLGADRIIDNFDDPEALDRIGREKGCCK